MWIPLTFSVLLGVAAVEPTAAPPQDGSSSPRAGEETDADDAPWPTPVSEVPS